MQTLFAPAVALMNRLRYRSKFLLLGTALTVVLGVLLFSVYSCSAGISRRPRTS
jgi:methyl-accepting chemotaxis protein